MPGVQCDHSNFQQHTVPGGDFCGPLTAFGGGPSTAFQTFGKPPSEAQLLNPNSRCGLKNSPEHHVAYCQEAGQDLMQGWGVRRNEWQFGVGIQHELLPRVSVEFTYSMRRYGNLTTADTVSGCDYFGPRAETMPHTFCAEEWLQYREHVELPLGIRASRSCGLRLNSSSIAVAASRRVRSPLLASTRSGRSICS